MLVMWYLRIYLYVTRKGHSLVTNVMLHLVEKINSKDTSNVCILMKDLICAIFVNIVVKGKIN